jgi:hypothetical protein
MAPMPAPVGGVKFCPQASVARCQLCNAEQRHRSVKIKDRSVSARFWDNSEIVGIYLQRDCGIRRATLQNLVKLAKNSVRKLAIPKVHTYLPAE